MIRSLHVRRAPTADEQTIPLDAAASERLARHAVYAAVAFVAVALIADVAAVITLLCLA